MQSDGLGVDGKNGRKKKAMRWTDGFLSTCLRGKRVVGLSRPFGGGDFGLNIRGQIAIAVRFGGRVLPSNPRLDCRVMSIHRGRGWRMTDCLIDP